MTPSSRFFKALLVSAFLLLAGTAAHADSLPESCQQLSVQGKPAKVQHVVDGDSIRLQDGSRVRLIGLDTPEILWRERRAEAYAHEARQALIDLLDTLDQRVLLVGDEEAQDRHQRSLAHVFDRDGRPIAAILLTRGLARSLIIPPNTAFLDCYLDAEAQAREHGRGVWSRPEMQVFQSLELPRDTRGFRRVEGRVTRIGQARHSVWINLEGNVALRIDRKDLAQFPDLVPEKLLDRRVRGRGFVYEHQGQLRMRLRHGAELELVSARQAH